MATSTVTSPKSNASQSLSPNSKLHDDARARMEVQIARTPRKEHWLTPVDPISKSIFGGIVVAQNARGDLAIIKRSCLKFLLCTAGQTLENPMSEAAIHRKLFIAASKSRDVGAHGILNLYDEYINNNEHIVVMEHAGGGDLFSAVERRGPFGEQLARDTFLSLARIVNFMHKADVAHLDLKSENWMLTKDCRVKIIDFGMALVVEDAKQKVQGAHGTTMYMAPEIYNKQPFLPFAADVYSLGVILFLLLANGHPYRIPSATDKQFRTIYGNRAGIAHMLAPYKISGHSEVNDLLAGMLCPEEKRLTMEQVLVHPWVTGKTVLVEPTHLRWAKPQPTEETSFVDFSPIRQTSCPSSSSSSSSSSTPSPIPTSSSPSPMDTSS